MIKQKPSKLKKLLSQLAHGYQNDEAIVNDETIVKMYDVYDNNPTLLTRVSLEQVLESLLDPVQMSFLNRNEFAKGLKQAYRRVKKDGTPRDNLRGAIGLVCFTLELLNIAGKQKQNSTTSLEWPQELLKDSAVREWFKKVYAPSSHHLATTQSNLSKDEKENLKRAVGHWEELNLEDPLDPDIPPLQLYRVGTTSFILRCQINSLAGEKLVLKCLLFPYTSIPEITKATRSYAWRYPAGKVPATTRTRSSTEKWILMDFVEGDTLQEFLEECRNSEQKANASLLLRTELLSSIGKPLLEALNDLSRVGFQHSDLTPSNIIVCTKPDKTIDKIVLIDLGRNYLYTSPLGLEANRDALFVAPEVKNGEDSDKADLYSFGMILIDLTDPIGAQGGTVPDSLYQYAPHLARFIEDLIDKEPEKRLLFFPLKDREDLYSIFTDLLKVLPPEREVKPGRFFWVEQFKALFVPRDQLIHAWKLWRISHPDFRGRKFWRILHPLPVQPEIARYSSRLFGWLIVSMATSWLIFLVTIVWGARDFKMNPFAPFYIGIPQALIPGCDGLCVPFIDKFQAPGYVFGMTNIPVRLVDFSVGLTQSAYYANILAGLTTRSMSSKLAYPTELSLRTMTIVAFPLVMIGNLYQPAWWLGLLILGLLGPGLVNVLCYRLAINTLKEARGELSTVPPLEDPSLKSFRQWGASMFYYIILMSTIWIGLQFHFLHDTLAYAFGAFSVNLFILCISKSIIFGPNVRGSLSRAFILGERLKVLKQPKKSTSTTAPLKTR